MNAANILTSIRLALIPVFGCFLYRQQYQTAAIFFLLSGITDVLDGYVARKYNLITSWGKFLDPVADKLMQVTALGFLTIQKRIHVIVLIIVVIKEILMIAGGVVVYRHKKFVVSSNWYGKLATAIFFAAIVLVLYEVPYSNVFIIIAAAATLYAFCMYTFKYIKIRKSSA